MTVTDTPDWSKPMPGGSRTILNDSFNLLSGGGQYVSGWMDVNAFSGLHIETNGFALPASFGVMEVQFQDASNSQPIFPKHDTIWRGDTAAEINVPVMGALARIVITGPSDNVNAQILVVGHGGGGSSSYRGHGRLLSFDSGVTIGAGAFAGYNAARTMEGPGHLVLSSNQSPGVMQVYAYDQSGNIRLLADFSIAASAQDMRDLWIPPQELLVHIVNVGGVSGAYSFGVWLGRA